MTAPEGKSFDANQIGLIQKKISLERSIQSSGNWFVVIAVFSMINTIIFALGGSLTFVIGLGITQIIDAVVYVITQEASGDWSLVIHIIGFGLDLGLAWIFIGIGALVKKKHQGVLVAGLAVYALDALSLLLFQAWLAVAFHAFFLFIMGGGFRSINSLKALEANGPIEIPKEMIAPKKPLFKMSKKTEVIITIVCLVLLIGLFACLFIWSAVS
jgi:hypothetical protein